MDHRTLGSRGHTERSGTRGLRTTVGEGDVGEVDVDDPLCGKTRRAQQPAGVKPEHGDKVRCYISHVLQTFMINKSCPAGDWALRQLPPGTPPHPQEADEIHCES